MHKIAKSLAIALIVSVITGASAHAGPATDGLSACLADNTSGKDRKDMARFVFVGMAAHPEIRGLSNVTEANREEIDKGMAAIFTRLLTEKCAVQTKLAMEMDGAAAIQTAFKTIGELAMQELMSNPAVSSSFSRFSQYIDQNKISSTFSK